MSCSSCNRDIRIKAKGLCGACYKRLKTRGTTDYYQSKRQGPCTVCKRDIKIVAGGLCAPCYQRKQKRGTTDYAPLRVRGICSVSGCGKPHAARGLCDMHHQRLLNTGDPEQTKRPDDWGAKEKHPLYNRWHHMRRHRGQAAYVAEWNDFLTFVADVGDPPEKRSMLFAADESKPLGPDNMVWKRAMTERASGEDEATYTARRQRVYRSVMPERSAAYDLKRHYGLTAKEYEALLESHGGKCAICGEAESQVIRGKTLRLAVDHCHAKGHVRGLLCANCNSGLGRFKDDPAALRRAAAYLEGETILSA